MQLQDLPDEILIIIVRGCDLYTLESLYNTCQRMRNIVSTYGVVKKGCLSRSRMATVTKFKTNFFKDISHSLHELNLSGVPDLNKTAIIPVLKKLKKLKVLDVSYTNLQIVDLQEINQICPTLRDLSISFSCSECAKVPKTVMFACQSIFTQLENVHFVGSVMNLLHSKIVFHLLAKANLNSLKYTIADKDCLKHSLERDYRTYMDFPNFNSFSVYILNWNLKKPSFVPIFDEMGLNDFPVLSMISINEFEYIIIHIEDYKPKVYSTPIFKEFFKGKFNVNTLCITEAEIDIFGNTGIMAWKKATTNFDKVFFDRLGNHIKQYIPCNFLLNNDVNVIPDTLNHDWFYNVPLSNVCVAYKDQVRGTNRKRQAAPCFVLNYDDVFKEKKYVELTLEFKYPTNSAISLSASSNYLKTLTFLSLVGLGRFSADFFNVLFHCCVNLVTLNVHAIPISPSVLSIARSLAISKSLRNLRLIHKRIDMATLFAAFSQCPNLENIHIVDETTLESNSLADPVPIIEKCERLYSIYIEAQITETTELKTLRMFNKAKSKYGKPHVNVVVKNLSTHYPRNYDPFVHVFRLNPLRPL